MPKNAFKNKKSKERCSHEQDFILVGVISWGFPDMDHRNATVYLTRVDSMVPWIINKMSTIHQPKT